MIMTGQAQINNNISRSFERVMYTKVAVGALAVPYHRLSLFRYYILLIQFTSANSDEVRRLYIQLQTQLKKTVNVLKGARSKSMNRVISAKSRNSACARLSLIIMWQNKFCHGKVLYKLHRSYFLITLATSPPTILGL